MSQRACERIFGVSNKTVAKLFEEAGDMAIAHVADLKNLEIKKIQADELHAFVGAKDKTLKRMLEADGEVRDEAGTTWAYLAMCADTKLVFAYKLGDRKSPSARAFFTDVRKKLKKSAEGGFSVEPTIVTDGLTAYETAFQNVFGADAKFGRIVKQYTITDEHGEPRPSSRFNGSEREAIQGVIAEEDIHTNYIERQNLNLRMQNRRYTRRTNGFSKTLKNHERHLALWILYHNFCWIPRPARPTHAERQAGSDRWHKRETAALAAGLTKTLWSIEDLLDATDEFVAARKLESAPVVGAPKPSPQLAPPVNDAGEVRDFVAPFWVYQTTTDGLTTRVHKASCCNCSDGQGRKPGASKYGVWKPFDTLEEAVSYAQALYPNDEVQCSVCLTGRYRRRAGLADVQRGNPSRQTAKSRGRPSG